MICDIWHATHDMWHVTRDMTFDMEERNLLSTFLLKFFRFWNVNVLNIWMKRVTQSFKLLNNEQQRCNGPRVAGAVLQTHVSIIHHLNNWVNIFIQSFYLRTCSYATMCHMSGITCHISCVTCWLSHLMSQLSGVIIIYIYIYFNILVGLVG